MFPPKKTPPKRHLVQIYLPSTSVSDRGQRTGADTLVLDNVFASVESLAGRELEQARQVFASASLRVRLFGDPNVPLNTKHYILFGSRRIGIGFVGDLEQVHYEYVLLCSEAA